MGRRILSGEFKLEAVKSVRDHAYTKSHGSKPMR
jgi:hypothetical protein